MENAFLLLVLHLLPVLFLLPPQLHHELVGLQQLPLLGFPLLALGNGICTFCCSMLTRSNLRLSSTPSKESKAPASAPLREDPTILLLRLIAILPS
jgi:hypothetical protein